MKGGDCMVYVAEEITRIALYKLDAWEINAEGRAIEWARNNGYEVASQVITPMGDMIIWVRR